MTRLLFAAVLSLLSLADAQSEEARSFTSGSWRSIVQAHGGRPTIVHFWGLTCGPCRIEMAHWGTLIGARSGFDFVTVDTDMVPTAPGQAESFLARSGVPVGETWHFADAFAEKLYFQVDPRWQGEIPMTVLVGRDGHVERLTGAADMAAVKTWLDAQSTMR